MPALDRRYLYLLVIYGFVLVAIAGMANLRVAAWVFDLAASLPRGDKVAHMLLAGLLAFLLNGMLHCRATSLLRFKMLTGNVIAYFLVLSEEATQFWIAARNVDIWDVLSGIVGIHLFGFFALHNMRLKERKAGGQVFNRARPTID